MGKEFKAITVTFSKGEVQRQACLGCLPEGRGPLLEHSREEEEGRSRTTKRLRWEDSQRSAFLAFGEPAGSQVVLPSGAPELNGTISSYIS